VIRGADIVYNLAAVHRDDEPTREGYFDTNVNGATALCEAAREVGVRRICFTSSLSVYGTRNDLIDESSPCLPESWYGESKLEAEYVLTAWQQEGEGRSLAIVRPTVIFGPGNRANVYRLMTRAVNGPRVFPGNGANRKSIAFVENIGAFLAHVATDATPVLVVNYADQPTPTVREFVNIICEESGNAGARQIWTGTTLSRIGAAVARVGAAFGSERMRTTAIRIGKFGSSSNITSRMIATTGFTPPVTLAGAIRRTVREDLVTPTGLASPIAVAGEALQPTSSRPSRV
jgi:nucleoside-diphosphate-sugar epimerase